MTTAADNDGTTFTGVARVRLLAERDSLDRLITIERDVLDDDAMSDHSSEIAPTSQHPADVASELFERECEFGVLEDTEAARDAIDRALTRLDHGTYGVCERCGTAIDAERLEAVPATSRCVRCQEAAEHAEAGALPGRRAQSAASDRLIASGPP